MMKNILLIGLAGGLGTIARYLSQKMIYLIAPYPFPVGTFTVNIIGCFLIGIFWGLSDRAVIINNELKLILIAGFCGGFTTFSALTFEGVSLLKDNKTMLFFIYISASVITGLFATWLGYRLFK